MKSIRTTMAFGGWCSLLGALAALAQTPAPVSGVATSDVTVAVTNSPAVATPAPAATVVTGVTHRASVSNAITHQVSVSNEVAIPALPAADVMDKSSDSTWKVGTRMLFFSLQDKTRGSEVNGEFVDTFMGSIMKIEEDQSSIPDRLFVQWRPFEIPVWLGVSYDHLAAKTVDNGGGDGKVELSGFVPYVQAAWANQTRFTPYVEAGLALYKADFKENEWSDGGRRTVKVSDPQGFELAVGTAIRIAKNWSADLYVREMTVDDVTGGYYIDGNKDGDVVFTLSHMAYGLGVTYEF